MMPHVATANDYRVALLQAVQREVERLKREEEGSAPREALSKAAIEALAERLTHFDTPRSL
jgi:hypothetical protein